MGFSDAQMDEERDGGTAGCTYAHCQEKKWTFAVESALLFHLCWVENCIQPVLDILAPDYDFVLVF